MKIFSRFPLLNNKGLFFVSNNNIYKFNIEKNSLECFIQTNSEISHLVGNDKYLIFLSYMNNSPDLFLLDIKTKK